jgi:RHS repeat-associated protein
VSFSPQVDNVVIYQNDHLGTPQKLTAINGATVWSAKYSSFGEANVDISSSATNNLRFPGQYYDQETGLHYNFNRYYDPGTGRYLTPDPSHSFQPEGTSIPYLLSLLLATPQELHNYTYCLNKPTSYIDVHGLWTEKLVPRYGSWGGPGWSGGNTFPPLGPVDSMDECFKEHDECYGWGKGACYKPNIKDCDSKLVNCLQKLPKDPRSWKRQPKYPLTAQLYRDAAMATFEIKN